jgi:hypothetical protein
MTRRIRYLTVAAAVLAGFLAGTAIDRELVTYPAWKFIGPLAWAEFSRHADLGSGVLVYASGAIGCTLLTIAATAALWRDRRGGGAAAIFLCAAAGLEIAALLLTLKAAPVMFGIRDTTEPADLARAFDAFRFWDFWRGASQVAAFIALVLALAAPRDEHSA